MNKNMIKYFFAKMMAKNSVESQPRAAVPHYKGHGRASHLIIFAFFDKDALMAAVPENGNKELKVTGKLKSGQYFYGCETVSHGEIWKL